MKAFNDIQSHYKKVEHRNFESIGRKGTQRIEHTFALSSDLATKSTQTAENKAVTETDKPSTESQKQNLVSGLFFDADLKLIIERWPDLSVELRSAIIKMIR